MTISKALTVVGTAVLISGGIYAYVSLRHVQDKQRNSVGLHILPTENQSSDQLFPVPSPLAASSSDTVSDTSSSTQQDLSEKDSYGFFTYINISAYYPDAALYSQSGYTYRIYSRETGGGMPIIKESTSTKEYTGLFIATRKDILSPDKHSFVFAPYTGNKLCVARIDPKQVTCLESSNPKETYVRIGGDFEEAYVQVTWIDNTKFQYAVYAKENPSDRGAPESAQPLRMETYTIK